jgi:hypothetical protein
VLGLTAPTRCDDQEQEPEAMSRFSAHAHSAENSRVEVGALRMHKNCAEAPRKPDTSVGPRCARFLGWANAKASLAPPSCRLERGARTLPVLAHLSAPNQCGPRADTVVPPKNLAERA